MTKIAIFIAYLFIKYNTLRVVVVVVSTKFDPLFLYAMTILDCCLHLHVPLHYFHYTEIHYTEVHKMGNKK